ncbi:transglycosylase family protein [Mycolicibacterium chubuense NBB4]|uniref:Transglycosylase family protein n=1 Tax=Mycolicibacterium chubuense (strain NBB4) TaxID=710421 RepID=I4BML7_MYCCN|nr:lytic transglycosylase domain-containing protein [Mycolicibacterium chubuense]AFM18524.1 transglycosylase family protein [Mycolicibacterium chubuense NBB4]
MNSNHLRVAGLTVAAVVLAAGCASTAPSATEATQGVVSRRAVPPPHGTPPPAPQWAQPRLASDPVRLTGDLVQDERTLRDRGAPEAVLVAAARRQQAAYRVLGRHPEWDAITRPRVPGPLLDVYDRNIDARRQLEAMSSGRGTPTLPAWRITAPAPPAELLSYYRQAEADTGVGWNVLAAINLVETGFGRISGVSNAGAQGPMQFLPSTFAAYSRGDIRSPRDSILAAGRFLAAQGFSRNRDQAIFRYNNSRQYVRAVNQYAAVIGADPAGLAGYYRWDVYYNTASGDVVLPVGYAATAPIPVEHYLADHPQ